MIVRDLLLAGTLEAKLKKTHTHTHRICSVMTSDLSYNTSKIKPVKFIRGFLVFLGFFLLKCCHTGREKDGKARQNFQRDSLE